MIHELQDSISMARIMALTDFPIDFAAAARFRILILTK